VTARRCRQATLHEHLLQAGRGHQHERPCASIEHLDAVRDLARAEDELARAGGELVVPAPEPDLAVTIMGMSIPYELTGRSPQKARTRAALVAATRHLLARGVTPTMLRSALADGLPTTPERAESGR